MKIMRRTIALIAISVCTYGLARIFYLKEIAQEPVRAEMFWLLLMSVVALVVFLAFSDGRHRQGGRRQPAPRSVSPPVPVKRRSKFDGISHDASPRQRHVRVADSGSTISELEAMNGEADRAAALPAWALLLRDPYGDDQQSTSWFGGLPTVPAEFDWPRDATHGLCTLSRKSIWQASCQNLALACVRLTCLHLARSCSLSVCQVPTRHMPA